MILIFNLLCRETFIFIEEQKIDDKTVKEYPLRTEQNGELFLDKNAPNNSSLKVGDRVRIEVGDMQNPEDPNSWRKEEFLKTQRNGGKKNS